MPSYFIYDSTQIVNFILADTKEIAEEVTQMSAIPFEEAPEGMTIGWFLDGEIWTDPNPPVIEESVPE